MLPTDRIIGGMFGLPDSLNEVCEVGISNYLFLQPENLFLANARSGIRILQEILRPRNVWFPSFLCPTMIEAIDLNKSRIRFYDVGSDLCIGSTDWIDDVLDGDLVTFIDYFGFPLDSDIAALAKEAGAWVLEDASQALLSMHVGTASDFVLFSPRKFLGVPDGGILVSCCDVSLEQILLISPPLSWFHKVLEANINRREFDKHGGERKWYDLFRETNESTPCGYFAMSQISKNLLFSSFNYVEISDRRISNFQLLSENLPGIGFYENLVDGTIPLGFPTVSCYRNQIRERLFRENIYPPVHWSIKGDVPNTFVESHRLSNSIMTLVCDQRYSDLDMIRTADLFQEK